MRLSKKNRIMLIVAVAMLVISILGQVMLNTNFGKVSVKRYDVDLRELYEMIEENKAEYGKEVDVTFYGDANSDFSFVAYVPKNATPENPAPAVVAIHGAYNSMEKTFLQYLELSRRGFVVITPNCAGHGTTDLTVDPYTGNTSGVTAAAEYAMSLPFVDETRIGVAGHSNGNRDAARAITVEQGTEHNRIRAFFNGASVAYQRYIDSTEDVFMCVYEPKYDEWDILEGGYEYLTSDYAIAMAQRWDPAFSLTEIPETQWISSDGTVTAYDPDAVNGAPLDKANGIAFYNPYEVHNQVAFSNRSAEAVATTFYAAFGVPEGAEYISPSNTVWFTWCIFSGIGLLGLFLLLFPLTSLLISCALFAPLKRELPAKETLPSFKSWKNWVPFVVEFLITTAYTYNAWRYDYAKGFIGVFDASFKYEAVNSVLYYFLDVTVFSIILMILDYFLKRLLFRKDSEKLGNPVAVASAKGAGELLLSGLFAVVVVTVIMVIVYITAYLFNSNFRIWDMSIYTDNVEHFFLFFTKYLPIFVLLLLPGAISNANMRFKDMPDWVSALLVGLNSCLGIAIFTVHFYTSAVNTGMYFDYDWAIVMSGMNGICAVPMLLYSAFAVRYMYKKTGNVWVAAFTNALLLGLMFFTGSACLAGIG